MFAGLAVIAVTSYVVLISLAPYLQKYTEDLPDGDKRVPLRLNEIWKPENQNLLLISKGLPPR